MESAGDESAAPAARGVKGAGPRRARAVALQALYEADVSGHPAAAAARRIALEAGLSRKDAAFAVRLAEVADRKRAALDARIARHAPAWPVEQIAAVDRNIIRLALAELESDAGTPPRVVVNEAVELAKLFGSSASQRFVNGVLGTVLG